MGSCRELASQIAKEAEALLSFHAFRAQVVYGGTNVNRCVCVWVGGGGRAARKLWGNSLRQSVGMEWWQGGVPVLRATWAAAPVGVFQCCGPA